MSHFLKFYHVNILIDIVYGVSLMLKLFPCPPCCSYITVVSTVVYPVLVNVFYKMSECLVL